MWNLDQMSRWAGSKLATCCCLFFLILNQRSAWLAQSVEDTTLDLGVVSSSPTLGVEIYFKKKKKSDMKPEDLFMWWHQMFLFLVRNQSSSDFVTLSLLLSVSKPLLIWRLRFRILKHQSVLWQTIEFIRGNSSLRFCFLCRNLLHEPSPAFQKKNQNDR